MANKRNSTEWSFVEGQAWAGRCCWRQLVLSLKQDPCPIGHGEMEMFEMIMIDIRKSYEELKRWLSSKEAPPQVWFPASTRWLTIVYNSGSGDLVLSSGLFDHRCTWYTDKHGGKHIHTLIYHLCVCEHGHVLRSEDNFVELVVSTFKWILEIKLRLPALCRKCLYHLFSLAFTLNFPTHEELETQKGVTSHGPPSVNDTTLLSIVSTHLAAVLTGLLLNLM